MLKHSIVIAALVAVFLLLALRMVSSAPFGYDEADYAFDAKLGLAANYTDTPTLPLMDFLRDGLGRGKSASQRAVLSEAIRNSNDVIFYRHWHGPLYFYWLILDSRLARDEHGMRVWSVGIPILSMLVVYFGCLWLTGGSLEAMLGSALFLWSWTTVGSTELAPHQLFVTCFLAGLFLLAKLVETGDRKYLLGAAVAAGLAFCTLEVTFVLVATTIVVALVERKRVGVDWKTALNSIFLFMATILLFWPGALLKLSFVKAYLFMAYLAVFRKAPWGNEGLIETWTQRFLNSPVEWILIAGAIALYVFDRQVRSKRALYPFLVFAALMIAATLRVTTGTPRYALPFMPALQVFAGLAIGGWLAGKGAPAAYASALVLCAALLASTAFQVWRHPPGADPHLVAVLNAVRENHATAGALLVPQDYVPPLHYYFPETHLRGYFGATPTPEELKGGHLTGILYDGNPVRFQPFTSHWR